MINDNILQKALDKALQENAVVYDVRKKVKDSFKKNLDKLVNAVKKSNEKPAV